MVHGRLEILFVGKHRELQCLEGRFQISGPRMLGSGPRKTVPYKFSKSPLRQTQSSSPQTLISESHFPKLLARNTDPKATPEPFRIKPSALWPPELAFLAGSPAPRLASWIFQIRISQAWLCGHVGRRSFFAVAGLIRVR